MIDTARVAVGPGGRRPLRFEHLDDLLADARACAAADDRGRLKRLGNWSVGQCLNHLAAWIDYPYLGYPPELVIPEEMRANAAAIKQTMMTEPMRPGENLPGLESSGGTLATEDMPAAAGLARLEAAVARLRAGDPPIPDPAFGRVTRHEWTEISLRHAELHLSFFVP